MNIVPAGQVDNTLLRSYRQALTQGLLTAASPGASASLLARFLVESDLTGSSGVPAAISQVVFTTAGAGAIPANTWTPIYTGQLPQNVAVGIIGYGQLVASPNIDAIRFGIGGASQNAGFYLDPLYCDIQERVGFFDNPIVYLPQNAVNVQVWSANGIASTGEIFALIGTTVEPQGVNFIPFNLPAGVQAALDAALGASTV